MNEIEILRLLNLAFNSHWNAEKVPENFLRTFRRRDFYTLTKELESKKITSIMGPRRVGKTTLMFQLIDHLITGKKVPPKRILYVSLDNPYLERVSDEIIKDVIEVYVKNIIKKPLEKLDGKIYVFLDEIQYVKNWPRKLKAWVDYGFDIKFIVSGSSSMLIRKGGPLLVGRMSERIILPLKFIDLLNYNGVNCNEKALLLQESLKKCLDSGETERFWDTLQDTFKELLKVEGKIKLALQNYLIKGGYPGLLDVEDYSLCSNELKDSILSKSILDIVERHGLRSVETIKNILSIIAINSGSRVAYSNLSENLGVERPTILNHLEYLEDAFLLSKSVFFTKSRMIRARKEKKLYVSDIGMRNSVSGSLNEMILQNPSEMGVAAETAAFDHAKRLNFYLNGYENADVFYWRYKDREIDIVLQYRDKAIPIEVKYGPVSARDADVLRIFAEQQKSPFGILVNPNEFRKEGRIFCLPLWFFLLIC